MLTLTMTFVKETKNCIAFHDETEAVIGTLYVRKNHLDPRIPDSITVTIAEATDPLQEA